MLTKIRDDKIIKINEDARNITEITNSSVDIILISFALHHINGPKYMVRLTLLIRFFLVQNKN